MSVEKLESIARIFFSLEGDARLSYFPSFDNASHSTSPSQTSLPSTPAEVEESPPSIGAYRTIPILTGPTLADGVGDNNNNNNNTNSDNVNNNHNHNHNHNTDGVYYQVGSEMDGMSDPTRALGLKKGEGAFTGTNIAALQRESHVLEGAEKGGHDSAGRLSGRVPPSVNRVRFPAFSPHTADRVEGHRVLPSCGVENFAENTTEREDPNELGMPYESSMHEKEENKPFFFPALLQYINNEASLEVGFTTFHGAPSRRAFLYPRGFRSSETNQSVQRVLGSRPRQKNAPPNSFSSLLKSSFDSELNARGRSSFPTSTSNTPQGERKEEAEICPKDSSPQAASLDASHSPRCIYRPHDVFANYSQAPLWCSATSFESFSRPYQKGLYALAAMVKNYNRRIFLFQHQNQNQNYYPPHKDGSSDDFMDENGVEEQNMGASANHGIHGGGSSAVDLGSSRGVRPSFSEFPINNSTISETRDRTSGYIGDRLQVKASFSLRTNELSSCANKTKAAESVPSARVSRPSAPPTFFQLINWILRSLVARGERDIALHIIMTLIPLKFANKSDRLYFFFNHIRSCWPSSSITTVTLAMEAWGLLHQIDAISGEYHRIVESLLMSVIDLLLKGSTFSDHMTGLVILRHVIAWRGLYYGNLVEEKLQLLLVAVWRVMIQDIISDRTRELCAATLQDLYSVGLSRNKDDLIRLFLRHAYHLLLRRVLKEDNREKGEQSVPFSTNDKDGARLFPHENQCVSADGDEDRNEDSKSISREQEERHGSEDNEGASFPERLKPDSEKEVKPQSPRVSHESPQVTADPRKDNLPLTAPLAPPLAFVPRECAGKKPPTSEKRTDSYRFPVWKKFTPPKEILKLSLEKIFPIRRFFRRIVKDQKTENRAVQKIPILRLQKGDDQPQPHGNLPETASRGEMETKCPASSNAAGIGVALIPTSSAAGLGTSSNANTDLPVKTFPVLKSTELSGIGMESPLSFSPSASSLQQPENLNWAESFQMDIYNNYNSSIQHRERQAHQSNTVYGYNMTRSGTSTMFTGTPTTTREKNSITNDLKKFGESSSYRTVIAATTLTIGSFLTAWRNAGRKEKSGSRGTKTKGPCTQGGLNSFASFPNVFKSSAGIPLSGSVSLRRGSSSIPFSNNNNNNNNQAAPSASQRSMHTPTSGQTPEVTDLDYFLPKDCIRRIVDAVIVSGARPNSVDLLLEKLLPQLALLYGNYFTWEQISSVLHLLINRAICEIKSSIPNEKRSKTGKYTPTSGSDVHNLGVGSPVNEAGDVRESIGGPRCANALSNGCDCTGNLVDYEYAKEVPLLNLGLFLSAISELEPDTFETLFMTEIYPLLHHSLQYDSCAYRRLAFPILALLVHNMPSDACRHRCYILVECLIEIALQSPFSMETTVTASKICAVYEAFQLRCQYRLLQRIRDVLVDTPGSLTHEAIGGQRDADFFLNETGYDVLANSHIKDDHSIENKKLCFRVLQLFRIDLEGTAAFFLHVCTPYFLHRNPCLRRESVAASVNLLLADCCHPVPARLGLSLQHSPHECDPDARRMQRCHQRLQSAGVRMNEPAKTVTPENKRTFPLSASEAHSISPNRYSFTATTTDCKSPVYQGVVYANLRGANLTDKTTSHCDRHVGKTHINTLREVISRLMEVALCDPEETIRFAALTNLRHEFDQFIYPHEDLLNSLFAILNDAYLPNRVQAIRILRRLAGRNPPAIYPRIRGFLIQLLGDFTNYSSSYLQAAMNTSVANFQNSTMIIAEEQLSLLFEIMQTLPQSVPLFVAHILLVLQRVFENPLSERGAITMALHILKYLNYESVREESWMYELFIPLIARQLTVEDGDTVRLLDTIDALQSILQVSSMTDTYTSSHSFQMLIGYLQALLYQKPSIGAELSLAVLRLLGTISSLEPTHVEQSRRVPALLRRPVDNFEIPSLATYFSLSVQNKSRLCMSGQGNFFRHIESDQFHPFSEQLWPDVILRVLLRTLSDYLNGIVFLTTDAVSDCLSAIMNILQETEALKHLDLYLPTLLRAAAILFQGGSQHLFYHPFSTTTIKPLFMKQLAQLVEKVKRSIAPMYPLLFAFLTEHWDPSVGTLDYGCRLMQALCAQVPDLVKEHCEWLLSIVLKSLMMYNDAELISSSVHRALPSSGKVEGATRLTRSGGASGGHEAPNATTEDKFQGSLPPLSLREIIHVYGTLMQTIICFLPLASSTTGRMVSHTLIHSFRQPTKLLWSAQHGSESAPTATTGIDAGKLEGFQDSARDLGQLESLKGTLDEIGNAEMTINHLIAMTLLECLNRWDLQTSTTMIIENCLSQLNYLTRLHNASIERIQAYIIKHRTTPKSDLQNSSFPISAHLLSLLSKGSVVSVSTLAQKYPRCHRELELCLRALRGKDEMKWFFASPMSRILFQSASPERLVTRWLPFQHIETSWECPAEFDLLACVFFTISRYQFPSVSYAPMVAEYLEKRFGSHSAIMTFFRCAVSKLYKVKLNTQSMTLADEKAIRESTSIIRDNSGRIVPDPQIVNPRAAEMASFSPDQVLESNHQDSFRLSESLSAKPFHCLQPVDRTSMDPTFLSTETTVSVPDLQGDAPNFPGPSNHKEFVTDFLTKMEKNESKSQILPVEQSVPIKITSGPFLFSSSPINSREVLLEKSHAPVATPTSLSSGEILFSGSVQSPKEPIHSTSVCREHPALFSPIETSDTILNQPSSKAGKTSISESLPLGSSEKILESHAQAVPTNSMGRVNSLVDVTIDRDTVSADSFVEPRAVSEGGYNRLAVSISNGTNTVLSPNSFVKERFPSRNGSVEENEPIFRVEDVEESDNSILNDFFRKHESLKNEEWRPWFENLCMTLVEKSRVPCVCACSSLVRRHISILWSDLLPIAFLSHLVVCGTGELKAWMRAIAEFYFCHAEVPQLVATELARLAHFLRLFSSSVFTACGRQIVDHYISAQYVAELAQRAWHTPMTLMYMEKSLFDAAARPPSSLLVIAAASINKAFGITFSIYDSTSQKALFSPREEMLSDERKDATSAIEKPENVEHNASKISEADGGRHAFGKVTDIFHRILGNAVFSDYEQLVSKGRLRNDEREDVEGDGAGKKLEPDTSINTSGDWPLVSYPVTIEMLGLHCKAAMLYLDPYAGVVSQIEAIQQARAEKGEIQYSAEVYQNELFFPLFYVPLTREGFMIPDKTEFHQVDSKEAPLLESDILGAMRCFIYSYDFEKALDLWNVVKGRTFLLDGKPKILLPHSYKKKESMTTAKDVSLSDSLTSDFLNTPNQSKHEDTEEEKEGDLCGTAPTTGIDSTTLVQGDPCASGKTRSKTSSSNQRQDAPPTGPPGGRSVFFCLDQSSLQSNTLPVSPNSPCAVETEELPEIPLGPVPPSIARYAGLAAEVLSVWEVVQDTGEYLIPLDEPGDVPNDPLSTGYNMEEESRPAGQTTLPNPMHSNIHYNNRKTDMEVPKGRSEFHLHDEEESVELEYWFPSSCWDEVNNICADDDVSLQRKMEIFKAASLVATDRYEEATHTLSLLRRSLRNSYAVFHTESVKGKLELNCMLQQISDLEEGIHAVELSMWDAYKEEEDSHGEDINGLPMNPRNRTKSTTSAAAKDPFQGIASTTSNDGGAGISVAWYYRQYNDVTIRRLQSIASRPFPIQTTILQRFETIAVRSALVPPHWQLSNMLILCERMSHEGLPMRSAQMLDHFSRLCTENEPTRFHYRNTLQLELFRILVHYFVRESDLQALHENLKSRIRLGLNIGSPSSGKKGIPRISSSILETFNSPSMDDSNLVPMMDLISTPELSVEELGDSLLNEFQTELLLLNVTCSRKLLKTRQNKKSSVSFSLETNLTSPITRSSSPIGTTPVSLKFFKDDSQSSPTAPPVSIHSTPPISLQEMTKGGNDPSLIDNTEARLLTEYYILEHALSHTTRATPTVWREFGLLLFDVCSAMHEEWVATKDSETVRNFHLQSTKAITALQKAAQLWTSANSGYHVNGMGPFTAVSVERHRNALSILPSAHLLLKALHLALLSEESCKHSIHSPNDAAEHKANTTSQTNDPKTNETTKPVGTAETSLPANFPPNVDGTPFLPSVNSAPTDPTHKRDLNLDESREEGKDFHGDVGGISTLDFSPPMHYHWCIIAPFLINCAAKHPKIHEAVKNMCSSSSVVLRQLLYFIISTFEHNFYTLFKQRSNQLVLTEAARLVLGNEEAGKNISAFHSCEKLRNVSLFSDEILPNVAQQLTRAENPKTATPEMMNDLPNSKKNITGEEKDEKEAENGRTATNTKPLKEKRTIDTGVSAPAPATDLSINGCEPSALQSEEVTAQSLGNKGETTRLPSIHDIYSQQGSPTVNLLSGNFHSLKSSHRKDPLQQSGGEHFSSMNTPPKAHDEKSIQSNILNDLARINSSYRSIITQTLRLCQFLKACRSVVSVSEITFGKCSLPVPIWLLPMKLAQSKSTESRTNSNSPQGDSSGNNEDENDDDDNSKNNTDGIKHTKFGDPVKANDKDLRNRETNQFPTKREEREKRYLKEGGIKLSHIDAGASSMDFGIIHVRRRLMRINAAQFSNEEVISFFMKDGSDERFYKATEVALDSSTYKYFCTDDCDKCAKKFSSTFKQQAKTTDEDPSLMPSQANQKHEKQPNHHAGRLPQIGKFHDYSNDSKFVTPSALMDSAVCTLVSHLPLESMRRPLLLPIGMQLVISQLPDSDVYAHPPTSSLPTSLRHELTTSQKRNPLSISHLMQAFELHRQKMDIQESIRVKISLEGGKEFPMQKVRTLEDFDPGFLNWLFTQNTNQSLRSSEDVGRFVTGEQNRQPERIQDPLNPSQIFQKGAQSTSDFQSNAFHRVPSRLFDSHIRFPEAIFNTKSPKRTNLMRRYQKLLSNAYDRGAINPLCDFITSMLSLKGESIVSPPFRGEQQGQYINPCELSMEEYLSASRDTAPEVPSGTSAFYKLELEVPVIPRKRDVLSKLLAQLNAIRKKYPPGFLKENELSSSPTEFTNARGINLCTADCTEADESKLKNTEGANTVPRRNPDPANVDGPSSSGSRLMDQVFAGRGVPINNSDDTLEASSPVGDEEAECRRKKRDQTLAERLKEIRLVLLESETPRYSNALRDAFAADSTDASHWLETVRVFTQELSEWSILQYLLDITNRDSGTIFVCPSTGHIVTYLIGRYSLKQPQSCNHRRKRSFIFSESRQEQSDHKIFTSAFGGKDSSLGILQTPFPCTDPSIFRLTPCMKNALPMQSAHTVFLCHAAQCLSSIQDFKRDLQGYSKYGLSIFTAVAWASSTPGYKLSFSDDVADLRKTASLGTYAHRGTMSSFKGSDPLLDSWSSLYRKERKTGTQEENRSRQATGVTSPKIFPKGENILGTIFINLPNQETAPTLTSVAESMQDFGHSITEVSEMELARRSATFGRASPAVSADEAATLEEETNSALVTGKKCESPSSIVPNEYTIISESDILDPPSGTNAGSVGRSGHHTYSCQSGAGWANATQQVSHAKPSSPTIILSIPNFCTGMNRDGKISCNSDDDSKVSPYMNKSKSFHSTHLTRTLQLLLPPPSHPPSRCFFPESFEMKLRYDPPLIRVSEGECVRRDSLVRSLQKQHLYFLKLGTVEGVDDAIPFKSDEKHLFEKNSSATQSSDQNQKPPDPTANTIPPASKDISNYAQADLKSSADPEEVDSVYQFVTKLIAVASQEENHLGSAYAPHTWNRWAPQW